MLWNASKLTVVIANTSKRTNEISNARSLVANPTASTESKISTVTSLAVTEMPQRNLNSYFVGSQDANILKDSQEKIIISDTCDSIITLPNNHQEDFAEPAVPRFDFYLCNPRSSIRRRWFRTVSRVRSDALPYLGCEVIQEDLSLNKNREISAMNWADRCSLKCRLYNSEHPHGGCRFSEPLRLLFITGVQPRKLRVKDWQNAHGKVGIRNCQCYLRSTETPKAPFSASTSARCLLCELYLSKDLLPNCVDFAMTFILYYYGERRFCPIHFHYPESNCLLPLRIAWTGFHCY